MIGEILIITLIKRYRKEGKMGIAKVFTDDYIEVWLVDRKKVLEGEYEPVAILTVDKNSIRFKDDKNDIKISINDKPKEALIRLWPLTKP